MSDRKFCHIHCHSVMSVRDGMLKISELIEKSIEYGECFALTDHGNIAGWIEYYNQAKKNKIKPIFGVEAYINQNRQELLNLVNTINKKIPTDEDAEVVGKEELKKMSERREELRFETNHLVLIAKNETGFYNIIRLMNEAYADYFYYRPLIDYHALEKMTRDENGSTGVIVTTACLASPLRKFLLKDKYDQAIDHIKVMKNIFHDDFYLEVQANNIPDQKVFNAFLIRLAKDTNTKLVIGDDSHYLTDKDADTHQDLLLLQNKNVRSDLGKTDIKVTYENKNGEIKTKKVAPEADFRKGFPATEIVAGQVIGRGKTAITITNVEEVSRTWGFSTDQVFFKDYNRLVSDVKKFHPELVDYLEEVYNNNCEINDKIEHIHFNTETKLPQIEDAQRQFVDLVKQKIREKKVTDRQLVDRIIYELDVIKRFGFQTYFLILVDVIDWIKKNNIGLGSGRGSVAGSYIAYLLDLHRIDPFDKRWNLDGEGLPFERFLSLDKLYNKVFVYDESGKKLEYLEIDEVTVQRNGQSIKVRASEIQEGDEII